jgi:hypothetical protein
MCMIFAFPVQRDHLTALVLIFTCVAVRPAATRGADPPSSQTARSTTGASVTSDRALNRRVLSEFGPYGTEAEAASTLDKALRTLIDQGGGILVVPHDAPKGWYPRNRVQAAFGAPGVSIVDARGGVERVHVPPLGTTASDGLRGGNRLIERDASATFPWQGTYSTEAIVSRFQGGASSYLDRLARPASRGRDTRLYVATLRGLFQGQVLRVTSQPEVLSGEGERVTVRSLGLDGTEPFIVADTTSDHPRGAIVYNKNVVNGLAVSDTANCDNQSMTLKVEKSLFGAGDTFVVSSLSNYQGNVMSAAGDEGGLCYAGDIVQDPEAFRGEVESWDRATRSLVFKPGAFRPPKLGTSRPIINMNPKKWVRGGPVIVVPPGFKYRREEADNLDQPLLVAPAGAGWDESLVGRFLAIDDPSESYAADETLSFGYAGGPGTDPPPVVAHHGDRAKVGRTLESVRRAGRLVDDTARRAGADEVLQLQHRPGPRAPAGLHRGPGGVGQRRPRRSLWRPSGQRRRRKPAGPAEDRARAVTAGGNTIRLRTERPDRAAAGRRRLACHGRAHSTPPGLPRHHRRRQLRILQHR